MDTMDEKHMMEEAEGEEIDFDEVDKLQELGINMSDINKLKSAGIYTMAGVLMKTMSNLTEIKGMSEAKISKIQDVCKKKRGFGFTTGDQMLIKRRHMLKVSTGAKSLDDLLQGGIESMSITEVFGEFRTGKTQLCHTLAVTAQLTREMGGGNGKVLYIDTEGTFRPERIKQIAERFNVDGDIILSNIAYARAYTHEQQIDLLKEAAAKMIAEPYALLIVDSATALFRVDFMGRGQLADRQQKLGQFLSNLTKLAEEFNVAVLITNQVVSDPGAGAMFMADPKKPIGGHIMAHASTTRLYLKKGRGEQRICKIYDSPNIPESDAIFQLTTGGIDSVKD